MRKSLLLLVAGLMTTTGLFAQSNNNVDDVIKIDQHAARQYREGEMIVKFKPSSNVNLRAPMRGATPGMSNIANVMDELGITDSEQLMPLSGAVVSPQTKSLTSVNGKTIEDSDMSSLYKLTFDATKVNVQEAIDKVSALEEVEYAEPNYIIYTLSTGEETGASVTAQEAATYQAEPLFPEQWGHGPLKMPYLWQQPKTTTKRPVIAILDTGVDITHPDLADNIWTNEQEANGAEGEDDDANGFADDLHGWDFVNQTARIRDWNGHGTHCAGIAAAVGNNGIGITGTNPDALIMPITVMQSDGTGDVATIIKGIDYAAANGADVISMSIGGYGYSIAEEQALAKAYSKAVLVAAAGNDFKCIDAHDCAVNKKNASQNGPMFPAAFTFVLGVEASNPDGSLTGFSNFDEDGPVFSKYGEEQLYNYELRAPGASIMSTYPGGRYKKLNGTSMACPFVAGGISRLLQSKEYASWEILFGDLIHTRKQNGYGNVDFEAAYKLTDEDRIPELGLVTYVLKDTIDGDADGRADAGETIALYPTLRNEWGVAQNITISLEVAENEDPTIVEILDSNMSFGKPLSSYAKAKSANALRFKVNENCVDGRHIRLVLRASCDNIAQELIQEFTITAENGVEIGGMITEDMTLYPNVHYIVTQPLAVPQGVTLTIKPGTILRFQDNTGISCAGNINCVGTADSMIVFTKTDLGGGVVSKFIFSNPIKYTKFSNLTSISLDAAEASEHFFNGKFENCIFENCTSNFPYMFFQSDLVKCNIYNNTASWAGLWFGESGHSATRFINTNICNNSANRSSLMHYNAHAPQSLFSSNIFGNEDNSRTKYNITAYYDSPIIVKFGAPSYLGSTDDELIREGIFDMYHKTNPMGFAMVDLSDRLIVPPAEAHGIVWKVVVNGYDAQDEFEQLPPLGVGKHKFEVYFNRPMDTSVEPFVAMGVRPPFTSHSISEEGSWSADSLIYTTYLTINGKTGADGLNRIYVSGARDNEYFDIPIENTRFNVEVSAAGSMATGLMAEAGLGKVSLTWETDEEDFADLLGYNLYRYTLDNEGTSSDSTIVNPTVIDSEETSFVDYNVVPGTTYYYVIKQLTTSLSTHALSNAVAATPLTAQKGDANGSMNVDIADVVTEVAYITYQDPQPFIFEAADVNSDTKVNVLDVVGTIGIITTPTGTGISGLYDEPVRYFVQDGILYVETEQPLGGVQVRLNVANGTEIVALDALSGMEQTGVWTAENEYLFLAYSMSGRTLSAGRHALLQIGDDAVVKEIVISDAKGKNITAINANTTGVGVVEAMQLQIPTPNPFSTVLNVPYVIGKEGNHNVTITFCDMVGRIIDSYSTVNSRGEYTYVWYPEALQDGIYMVSLYVDGVLMQTAKVICNN